MINDLANDRWRLNNLYYVVNKQSQKVLFEENSVQAMINDCEAPRKAVLKARQFGVSTNEIIKMFDYVCFNRNVTACILAHEQDSIKKLFRIIRRAYDFMDPDLRPILDRGGGSKYEMYFPEKNSRIYADLESRGDTINYLHCSEVAFMKDKLKLDATLQAVPLGGKVSLETTANGIGQFFYDIWSDPKSPYEKLFFPWFDFDEYQIPCGDIDFTDEELKLVKKYCLTKEQISFRRLKKSELKGHFLQEYPEDDVSCFLASGNSALDLTLVKRLLDNLEKPINTYNCVKIFKGYDKTRRYVCGADTAEGIKQDYSVATIYDVENCEQVATLRGHMSPHEFAHQANELCSTYRTGGRPHPMLAVERNNHGHAVLLELEQHIRYPNLYKHKDGRPGWITDRVTRPIMIDTFIEGVENQTCKLNDSQTLKECMTLIDNNGKIEAAQGKHDDCVIASAIALQLCTQRNLDVYKDIGAKIRMA